MPLQFYVSSLFSRDIFSFFKEKINKIKKVVAVDAVVYVEIVENGKVQAPS